MEIPIVVNTDPHLMSNFINLGLRIGLRKAITTRQIQTHDEKRHNIAQSTQTNPITRTRRISTSTAAKRFPKDFFTLENRLPPTKCKGGNILDRKPLPEEVKPNKAQKSNPIRGQQSPKSQKTPQFSQNKVKRREKNKQLSHKQQQHRNEFLADVNQFNSVKYSEKMNPSKMERRQKEGICDITFKANNLNVTLGQKINTAVILKKERERKRMDRLRKVEPVNHFPVLQGVANRQDNGFRIRRRGLY